jgi:hypothetical protein
MHSCLLANPRCLAEALPGQPHHMAVSMVRTQTETCRRNENGLQRAAVRYCEQHCRTTCDTSHVHSQQLHSAWAGPGFMPATIAHAAPIPGPLHVQGCWRTACCRVLVAAPAPRHHPERPPHVPHPARAVLPRQQRTSTAQGSAPAACRQMHRLLATTQRPRWLSLMNNPTEEQLPKEQFRRKCTGGAQSTPPLCMRR